MNVLVCHSHHDRCGVREYGLALDRSLVMAGVNLKTCSYANFSEDIHAAESGDVLLVHHEPSLVTAWYLNQHLDIARTKGMRVVFCCHLYQYEMLREYNGRVDRFVIHRDYAPRHAESTIIPLGCPVFDPPATREEIRKELEYPDGSVVMTTLGFLTRWKQIPEITLALLNVMLPYPELFLHVHTPKPYYEDEMSQQEEPRIRGLLETHPAGKRALFTTEFLPDAGTLELTHAADVGFLFHPIHTGSVSAATKQFVSTRRPLVVTDSTHATDLRGGVERVSGFDTSAFAHTVVALARDPDKRARLAAEMQAEYDRINMHAVAREYVELFRSLA